MLWQLLQFIHGIVPLYWIFGEVVIGCFINSPIFLLLVYAKMGSCVKMFLKSGSNFNSIQCLFMIFLYFALMVQYLLTQVMQSCWCVGCATSKSWRVLRMLQEVACMSVSSGYPLDLNLCNMFRLWSVSFVGSETILFTLKTWEYGRCCFKGWGWKLSNASVLFLSVGFLCRLVSNPVGDLLISTSKKLMECSCLLEVNCILSSIWLKL